MQVVLRTVAAVIDDEPPLRRVTFVIGGQLQSASGFLRGEKRKAHSSFKLEQERENEDEVQIIEKRQSTL